MTELARLTILAKMRNDFNELIFFYKQYKEKYILNYLIFGKLLNIQRIDQVFKI